MNKLTSYDDLCRRFCWEDGKLYSLADHKHVARDLGDGRFDLPPCYGRWARTPEVPNYLMVANCWNSFYDRAEWRECNE